ncbi:glutaredoxin family protein [Streptomyces sp. NBC_00620]|uniref:glutaredoxin family protein n=1 Tax=unclassified Streptomyces TaxID=2593676 RepID=UPI002250E713|nr:glutaredoxin family protein [Streptomyces sp. NBC_00620]MCX4972455.1 glutaredoxin family protein [Streptomyces sp. NBC_00620]
MAGMSSMFRRGGRRTEKAEAGVPGEQRLVTLIRKPGCHLCDDAQEVVARVCDELGVVWEQKDISTDEALYRAYWEQIPVVLVDGAQHTFWRVNEERLRKALT